MWGAERAVADLPPCVILAEETWGGALHAIRSLGEMGVPVLVAVAGEGARVYGASRHCFAAEDFDSENPTELCSRVVDWVERTAPAGAPIPVLPLSDRLVEALHRSRDRFGSHYRLAIPAPESAELFLDKASVFDLVGRFGLDVPQWVAVESSRDIVETRALRLPVVARPRRWSSAGRRPFKLEVHHARSLLEERLERGLAEGAEFVVQEQVVGPDEAVEWVVLYRSYAGSKTVACTGRKRRQDGPEGGVMVWGESLEIPEARRIAERFVAATGFRGLGGLEVKRDGERRYFIEFNPRLEAIHFLARRSGLDTVRMVYEELSLGSHPGELEGQGRASAWLGNAWLARLVRTGDWRLAVSDVGRFLAAPQKVFAVWSVRDPLPWLVVSLRLAGRVLSQSFRRLCRWGRSP